MADEATTTVETTTPAPESASPVERDASRTDAALKVLAEHAEEEAPAEEVAPEVPALEPAAEAPAADPDAELAAAHAELARRDRAMRAREQQWKAQAREYEQMKAALTTLRDDPISTLMQLGVDLSEIVSKVGSQEEATPKKDPALEELKQWKEQVEQERQQARATRVYQQELVKIKSIAEAAPDDYEAVLGHDDGLHRVFQTLDGYYRQTGLVPTPEDYREAVRVVEEAYRQEELTQLESLAKAKRHQGKVSMVAATTKQPAVDASKRAPTKTLSQELQRESPPRSTPMTEDERVAEAIRIAKESDISL